MKTSTKVILITATSLVVVGLGLTAVASAAGGGFGNVVITSPDYEEVNYDFTSDINKLDIQESSHDVEFIKSTDPDTHVTVYDAKTYEHKVEVTGDTLKITSKSSKKAWYLNVGINVTNDSKIKTKIYLPEEKYDELLINVSSSDITVPSEFTFENTGIVSSSGDIFFSSKVENTCTVKTSSGGVILDDTDAKAVTVTTSSGDQDIRNLNGSEVKIEASSGEILIENCDLTGLSSVSSSGSLNLTDVKVEGALEFQTSSGEVRLVNISADKMTGRSSSGDISLSDLVLTSESSINTSSGDVDVKNSSFFYDVTTSSGDIKVDNNKEGVTLKVETTSGDVTAR